MLTYFLIGFDALALAFFCMQAGQILAAKGVWIIHKTLRETLSMPKRR